jgi:hypothetical protein
LQVNLIFSIMAALIVHAGSFLAHAQDLSVNSEYIALGRADKVLQNPNHPDYPWVLATYGRVGVLNMGNFAVWGRTAAPNGILITVTAGHVVTLANSAPELVNPLIGGLVAKTAKFILPLNRWSQPAIPSEISYLAPRTYLSRMFVPDGSGKDFSVLAATGLPAANVLAEKPLDGTKIIWTKQEPIDDPLNFASFREMQNPPEVISGEKIIAIAVADGVLRYSIGRALTSSEVAARGLEIHPWEFVVDGADAKNGRPGLDTALAIPGMSGTGVFNKEGKLVGILNGLAVSDKYQRDHFRATRLTFIANELRSSINKLSSENRASFSKFWTTSCDQIIKGP